MTALSQHPDRAELREYYENSEEVPADCHENYGDVNPAPHGGMWVTYDPDRGHFELIGTFHAAEMGFDVDPEAGAQWVYQNEAYFGDIVTEDGEFTDAARRTADSLYGANDTPAGLVVDGRMTWFVAALLDEHRHQYRRRGGKDYYEGEYSEILEKVGVEPCEDLEG